MAELEVFTPGALRQLRAELTLAASLAWDGGPPQFWWPARPVLSYPRGSVFAHFADEFPPLEVCWLWRGRRDKSGHAVLVKGDGFARLQLLSTAAYRALFTLFVDTAETGEHLDHLCDRRTEGCANPFHCEQVAGHVNSDRARDRWQMYDLFRNTGVVQARWSPSGHDEPFREWETVLQERGLPAPPTTARDAASLLQKSVRRDGRLPKNRSLAADAKRIIRERRDRQETET